MAASDKPSWFFVDLGNTVVKLAYERVIENILRESNVDRDELLELFDEPGGYRDMERGARNFAEFFEFLRTEAGYRADIRKFQETWSDFFDGTIPGIEDLLRQLRSKYRLAFLSNSNEIHAEVIPRRFSGVFEKDDRFIFSYRYKVAKPDPEMFHRALELVGTSAKNGVLIDDLIENVIAARGVGMRAFQFIDTPRLMGDLKEEGLL